MGPLAPLVLWFFGIALPSFLQFLLYVSHFILAFLKVIATSQKFVRLILYVLFALIRVYVSGKGSVEDVKKRGARVSKRYRKWSQRMEMYLIIDLP